MNEKGRKEGGGGERENEKHAALGVVGLHVAQLCPVHPRRKMLSSTQSWNHRLPPSHQKALESNPLRCLNAF